MSSLNGKYLPMIARWLLGLVFLVFGLNGLFGFVPMPPMPDAAGQFMEALAATGYMLPLIKLTEITGGLLLLFNRYVALALALLAPGIVNIALFHLLLAPAGIPLAAALLAAEIYLAYAYRDLYRPMLSGHVVPTARKPIEDRYTYDHPMPAPGAS